MLRWCGAFLAVALVALALSLWAQPRRGTPDPCQQRLERIGMQLITLVRTREGVQQFEAAVGKGREEVERLVKEPLTCPVLKEPYLLLPEELKKRWQMLIILADPKPHPDKRQWALVPTPKQFPQISIPEHELVDDLVVTPLPPSKEIQRRFKPFRIAAQATECLSNLRQIGLAFTMYVSDHDGRCPPMKDAKEAAAALVPYLRNQRFFTCPVTHKPYQPNPHLHLKALSDIAKPSETPAFYDAQPHPDRRRGVVFANGYAKVLDAQNWRKLQEQHKLPTPK